MMMIIHYVQGIFSIYYTICSKHIPIINNTENNFQQNYYKLPRLELLLGKLIIIVYIKTSLKLQVW